MTQPQPSQPSNKDLAGYCGNVQQNIVWVNETCDKEAAAHKDTSTERTQEDSTDPHALERPN